MNRQRFFDTQPDELLHVVPVDEHIFQNGIANQSPFHPLSIPTKIRLAFVRTWLKYTEKLIGSKLYVHNELRELFAIDSRVRSLLLSLIEKKIVVSWERSLLSPDLPNIMHCFLRLNFYTTPSGRKRTIQGNRGEGVGNTINEALIIALAESLERHSLCTWESSQIIRGSFNELKDKGAVHPDTLTFFSEHQLGMSYFARNLVSEDKKMGWMKAQSLTEKKQSLIPAQLVNILYTEEYPNEPYFLPSSSNGAAAAISFDEAVVRAICEAIERDGLFIFWLNGISPPKIDLDSISIPSVQKYIKIIKQYKLDLHILDITTDLGIPAFCAVLIDSHGDVAVSISATAGFDVPRILERLVLEILKYPHVGKLPRTETFLKNLRDKYPNIETFEERRTIWSDKKMIPNIQFFLQGKTKKFSDVTTLYADLNTQSKLKMLVKTFKEKNHKCYIVDITSSEARDAGLAVVKAVIPTLMPFYFREREKCLGVKRLYTLPVEMGYLKQPLKEDKLNSTPHPFI